MTVPQDDAELTIAERGALENLQIRRREVGEPLALEVQLGVRAAGLNFRDVLNRGGIIGGSSAGASIQAEFMVRGHPLGNQVMMAEGYLRGFNFLPGVAIDQHLTQRERQARAYEEAEQWADEATADDCTCPADWGTSTLW